MNLNIEYINTKKNDYIVLYILYNYIFNIAEGSPFVVPDDTDGLVSVCCPGDRPLGNNLAQGEDMRPRVGEVDVVLKDPRLVGKVGRLREGRVGCKPHGDGQQADRKLATPETTQKK